MQRSWIVIGLAALAIVGGFLILTAGDDEDPPPLETVTTDEGLTTQVPEGWVGETEFPWEFHPPGGAEDFDLWTVARACPPEGCRAATLDEWMVRSPELPTFVDMRSSDGDGLFNLDEERLDDAYVLRAQTASAGRVVFVAAFADGADAYVACSVRLTLQADERLADEIVRVCRETAATL